MGQAATVTAWQGQCGPGLGRKVAAEVQRNKCVGVAVAELEERNAATRTKAHKRVLFSAGNSKYREPQGPLGAAHVREGTQQSARRPQHRRAHRVLQAAAQSSRSGGGCYSAPRQQAGKGLRNDSCSAASAR